jgi:8-hydroxy-5-deazaflavin:NADPH oxidoreductase
MNIAVLGTAMVGRAIAGRLAELGHDVTIGTRDPAATSARTDTDQMGNPPFSTWAAEHPGVALATFASTAAGADLVVNATTGSASLEVLNLVGSETLAGKVLIDVANPLDHSRGMPPSLDPVNTDSLAEQIQRAFPQTKVVKALNTMNAHIMVNPARVAGEHSVFVAGDDEDAKGVVKALLGEFGWPAESIIDLGDITTARGPEMLLPMWIRLWGALGHAEFNFHIQGARTA